MKEFKDNENLLSWVDLSSGVSAGHFKNSKGNSLYLKRFVVNASVKKRDNKETIRILFLHDILDHHDRYFDVFNQKFNGTFNSLEFVFLDIEGHGLSNGTRGHVDNIDDLVTDVFEILSRLEKVDHLYFFGHGFGALIFLRFLLFNRTKEKNELLVKFKGLIASSFYFDFENILNPMIKILNYIEKRTTPMTSIQMSHIKMNRLIHGHDLSHQREVQEKYESDPLVVHRLSFNGLRVIEEALKEIIHKAYFIDFPFLCLVGKNDPLINHQKINLFMKSVEKKHFQVIELSDSKHDIYNDTDSGFVIKEIIQWIKNAKK